MKVKINDDAHGYKYVDSYSYDKDYSSKGSIGSWVEKYRGQIFEVEEDREFAKNNIWVVVTEDRKYPHGNGIHVSQATLVEEPIIVNFDDLPIGSSFKTTDNDIAIKTTERSYFCLYGNNKFKTIIPSVCIQVYSISLTLEIEKYKPEYLPFKIDSYRKLYIYKNGDVKYYLNDKHVASKNINEIKSILKWTKKSKDGSCLSDNSVLKIDCQEFTIKDIKDFSIVYEEYINK